MEDIFEKEHSAGFHTSEDWANLKNKCYECYKACLRFSTPRMRTEERNEYSLSSLDYSINKNPLG